MEGDGVLPVLPWASAALAVVLLVGLQVPAPDRSAPPLRARASPVAGRAGALVLGLLGLLLALGARLLGDSELENPVSALVVGLGWPLLLLLPLLLSPLRRPAAREEGRPSVRGTDPDGRVAAGPGSDDDVRAAVPLAALVVLLLAVVPAPGRPAVLGPALAAYLLLVVAVGIAAGRPVAARAEVLGLLARWAALGSRLVAWRPPRGAAPVLVLVLAGAWSERVTRSTAWLAQVPGTSERLLLLVLAVLLAASLALPVRRRQPAALLLPLAVGAVVAGGLRRALISAQLLRDAVQPGAQPVVPDPLGVAGGQLLALAVATALGAVAAVVLARRSGPAADRLPGLAVVLAASGITAVLALQP